jgi:S1-C subfamily serine protease
MAVVLAVLIAMAAGFSVGHWAWQPGSAGGSQPSTTSPFSGNSGGFPFGSGGFPFGTSGTSGTSGSSSTASGGPADANAIASNVDPAVVDVNTSLGYEAEEAAGTGIVLTSTGEVLTNNHVIDGATSISVTDVGNGQVYGATVVGYDRSSDIALLQLHGASGLKVASIGNSSTVHVGEAVVAIGNAGGVGGTPSVAGGSVTATGQSITATEEDGGNPENLTGLIEVNSDIQPGDSGGPLVNTSGKVLGMDTAAAAGFSFQTTGAQGYAIPIDTAIAIAKRIKSGQASPAVHIGATGFLGVKVEANQSGSSGAEIEEVEPSTPAAAAGLTPGDVITSLNGKAVSSPEALSTLIQRYHPGDRVQLRWTDSSGVRRISTLKLASGPAA